MLLEILVQLDQLVLLETLDLQVALEIPVNLARLVTLELQETLVQ